MEIGDRVIIPNKGIIPESIWQKVEGRAGYVTEFADRGDIIVRFWEGDYPFEKRFRHHEVQAL